MCKCALVLRDKNAAGPRPEEKRCMGCSICWACSPMLFFCIVYISVDTFPHFSMLPITCMRCCSSPTVVLARDNPYHVCASVVRPSCAFPFVPKKSGPSSVPYLLWDVNPFPDQPIYSCASTIPTFEWTWRIYIYIYGMLLGRSTWYTVHHELILTEYQDSSHLIDQAWRRQRPLQRSITQSLACMQYIKHVVTFTCTHDIK